MGLGLMGAVPRGRVVSGSPYTLTFTVVAVPRGRGGQRYCVAVMIPARIRPRPPSSTTFDVSQNTPR